MQFIPAYLERVPIRLQILSKSAVAFEKSGSTRESDIFHNTDKYLALGIVQPPDGSVEGEKATGNVAVEKQMRNAASAEAQVKVYTHYIDGSKVLQNTVVLKDRFRPSGQSHWFEFTDDNTEKRVLSGTLQAVLPSTAISS